MKVIIAVCLVMFVLVCLKIGIAHSFEPINQRHFPGSSTNSPMMVKVGSTGVMNWEAIDSGGTFPGWRNLVRDFLNTGSSESTSLGNVINRFLAQEGRGSITIREDTGNPDLTLAVASTAFVEAKCGTGSYTACVYLLSPLPAPAYFKAPLMLQYQRSGQGAVIIHEAFHALGRACDQYPGGCPRVSDGQWGTLGCTGNPDSVMDCGGAARTAQRFDYDTFVGAYAPTTPFLQQTPPVPCGEPCWSDGPGGFRWRFADGRSFAPDSGCGSWYSAKNTQEWGPCAYNWDNDPDLDGRYNAVMGDWVVAGSEGGFYHDETDEWFSLRLP